LHRKAFRHHREEGMEIRDALSHIAEIRARLAEADRFRGYRSMPVAVSGCLAIVAALVQPRIVGDPVRDVLSYCGLWICVALVSVGAAGMSMMLRDQFGTRSSTREITRVAISRLVPALVAGGLTTLAIVRNAPVAAPLLPGLWQVFFSLGLFASCGLLPRATFWVAAFYLASGVFTISLAETAWAMSPWVMGAPFAIGQFLAACVLYWNLERTCETA
jgi:hypothetical protein